MGSEKLLSRVIYGDSLQDPQLTNHRGRVYRSYDGGGQSTVPAYDFKGLPISSSLTLPLDPAAKNDWTSIAGARLEAFAFNTGLGCAEFCARMPLADERAMVDLAREFLQLPSLVTYQGRRIAE